MAPGQTAPDRTDTIVSALAGPGWCMVADFLSGEETAALRAECRHTFAAGAFHEAGVGRGPAAVRSEIRGDHVHWVEESRAGPALKAALARLETLRLAVNGSLFLGLFDVELHFAVYPPGAGYRRHLDRFRDDDRRGLTVILYLNEDWQPDDGGLLRFWPEEDGEPLEMAPAGGTLVTFLSDRFWHEVLPARRERLSLTGWFRRR
jgi:SM-20-related protein